MKTISICTIGRTILFLLLSTSSVDAIAQAEVEPWGNITGIRVDGQLMEFESSLRFIDPNGWIHATAKERQNPHYTRNGNEQLVNTHLDSLYFTESIADSGKGMARVRITCMAHADINMRGAFFSLDIPEDQAANGKVQLISTGAQDAGPGAPMAGIRIISPQQQIEIRLDQPALITDTMVLQSGHRYRRIAIALQMGALQKGQSVQTAFVITASGQVDRAPVHLSLNTAKAGRVFDGLGGNFRIQNTALDPQVISYCLEHLRVAWARVELPWRFWQPVKDSNPLDSAKAGHLHPAVQRAIDMAHTLGDKKIPLIVSAWFPPDWAIEGPIRFRPGPDHIWGNPLNKTNTEAIYRSIADYIVFLKQQYKVEAKYFSFNESDLGINIRQTSQDHDELIKGLGAYFASRGLATRVLLGDNSDATTYTFINRAMEDSAARPYIGAVSFHSWRGWDTATLEKWADAATRLQLPLLVAEGSIDAAAWNYPAIFLEPTYALKEISLYTKLLAICQPASILQWQLTADYSPLAGGGIFRDTSALHPTQRFWNLQQLSRTPEGLSGMPVSCDRPNIVVAALGNHERRVYALHLVNNGATRKAFVEGLPAGVKALHIYTTNQKESVKEGERVKVVRGKAEFTLETQSYVTLISQ